MTSNTPTGNSPESEVVEGVDWQIEKDYAFALAMQEECMDWSEVKNPVKNLEAARFAELNRPVVAQGRGAGNNAHNPFALGCSASSRQREAQRVQENQRGTMHDHDVHGGGPRLPIRQSAGGEWPSAHHPVAGGEWLRAHQPAQS